MTLIRRQLFPDIMWLNTILQGYTSQMDICAALLKRRVTIVAFKIQCPDKVIALIFWH